MKDLSTDTDWRDFALKHYATVCDRLESDKKRGIRDAFERFISLLNDRGIESIMVLHPFGYDSFKLKLIPLMRGENYGLLTLYVEKKNFIPLRIDYHDTDTVIFKTLSVAKVITRNNKIIPVRYDMLDIRKGTVTLLEFFGFDENIQFDKRIFRHQNLGEEG